MSMMRARVQGHRWVDHPAAAVMKARVPGQWVDRPAAVVMEAREQGRCWIDHPAVAGGGGDMRVTRRNRSCGRQLAVLTAVSCLLFLLLLLTTVHVPSVPAFTATHCSTRRQSNPDLHTLYFTPRSRPITKIVSHFLVQPSPQICSSRLDLLILVPSSPEAVHKRQVIRRTWGSVVSQKWPHSKSDRKVALIFLLGRKGGGEGFDLKALRQEAGAHGDLLLGDFVDSYRNLTRKILSGLKWVSGQCTGRVSYVLKADLDTFVHVDLLLDITSQLQGDRPLTNTMLGELLCSESANRDPESRVYVDPSAYPFAVYPPYVRGGSYVLSGDIVTPLVNASQHLPLLPVEDAFINGVVARALNVQHVHVPGVMKGLACALSPCLFLGSGQVSATNVDPDMMQAIWRQLREGPQLCHHQASWWTDVCIWVSQHLS
ncbi:hypothetical protein ACOMHN_009871 [Nucella lapillus]